MILPEKEDKGLMNAMLGQLGGLGGLAALAGGAGGSATADLYVSMMKSEAIKDPIIERFKLMEVYRKKYRMDAYKKLDKSVSISAGKRTVLLRLLLTIKIRNARLTWQTHMLKNWASWPSG